MFETWARWRSQSRASEWPPKAAGSRAVVPVADLAVLDVDHEDLPVDGAHLHELRRGKRRGEAYQDAGESKKRRAPICQRAAISSVREKKNAVSMAAFSSESLPWIAFFSMSVP